MDRFIWHQHETPAKEILGDVISLMQRPFRTYGRLPRRRSDYLRCGRWWRLEALRRYPSAARSLFYAQTQEWFAELAEEYGEGSSADLLERSGNKMPAFDAARQP